MKCPHRNSMSPPCQIDTHPDRHNVEYCRVCGEWRYISDVGDDFPREFWTFVAVAIAGVIFVLLLNQADHRRQLPESGTAHPVCTQPWIDESPSA